MGSQRFEVHGIVLDEILIKEVFVQDDADHAGHDCGVLSWDGLQVEGRFPGRFRSARIDDDHLDAALHGLSEVPVRIGGGRSAESGNGGVGSNEEPSSLSPSRVPQCKF